MLVAGLFVVFIAIGSAVIPLWENQLTYFDSVYFSYMWENAFLYKFHQSNLRSLTTIGLGDIVPRRMDFLLPTLIYITIGLWLTTALVEQLADVFRLVHYAGRQVTNVKGVRLWSSYIATFFFVNYIRMLWWTFKKKRKTFQITVWLGGRRLSMGGLISTVCRRVGMSDNLISEFNDEEH